MRLLILTQYYPPETGAPQRRLSDLAKRFVSFGHQVEVLTALPNYPRNAVFPEYRNRSNSVEMMEGVRVARVNIYVPDQKTFRKRIAHYLSFVWNACRSGNKLVSRPDLILMESPPLFLSIAGAWLASRFGAKLAVNISDLWPQTAQELGMIPPGFFLQAGWRLEAWTYRRAHLISGQTQGIVENIRTRFPQKKVVFFPNGIDPGQYPESADRQKTRQEFGWDEGLMVIGYAGVLGHAQRLDQILNAAKRLCDLKDVLFVFFGAGPCEEALKKRTEWEGIKNVRFYPVQKAEKMPEIYAGMDIGCVPLGKEKIFETARPSKMFEMMAAGLPVILCAQGESAEILRAPSEGPAGIAVPPEEPAILAAEIRRLAGNCGEIPKMGARGRRHVFAHFDREKIARDFEKELTGLLR